MKIERLISAGDLAKAADLAHDAERLPTPESAGFEENAIGDFLVTYPAFEVPATRDGENELAHPGSLMAGIAIGAVAARAALEGNALPVPSKHVRVARGLLRQAAPAIRQSTHAAFTRLDGALMSVLDALDELEKVDLPDAAGGEQ